VKLGSFQVVASDGLPVHNVDTGLNYSSIQAAMDAPETLGGQTIVVDSGTYGEHLVVEKSLAIIGAGRDRTIINGSAGMGVQVVADNVLIKGFEVTDAFVGILMDHADNCVLSDNSVTNCAEGYYAVYVSYSQNCTIERNIVGPNSAAGVLVTNSAGFTISGNRAVGNGGYGLNANASVNGLISWNDAVDNSYDGIGLGFGCTNCTVFGNNVTSNVSYGIWVDSDSVGNLIYDNNIVKNYKQASVNLANRWDNGVEGNYWSDYAGVDSDRNGIIDEPLIVDPTGRDVNVDNHPLAGEFQSFQTSYDYRADIVSNLTIKNFAFFESNGTIRFTTSDGTTNQDYGFCRTSIPHRLVTGPYNVSIDETNPLYVNYTLYDDGENRWIYFNYQNLGHEISIQGIDKTIPAVLVLSPTSKTYDTSDIPLVFTVNEPPSWMAYSLDGQSNVTINGNVTMEGVSNGTHYVTVYSRDTAGNIGASSPVFFTVNVTVIPFVYWTILVVVVVVVAVFSFFIYLRRSRKRASKTGR
jgi:parallel beta-helix repeat protein